jgi:hypothetical protein
LFVDKACMELNPPMAISLMAASEPPTTNTFALYYLS